MVSRGVSVLLAGGVLFAGAAAWAQSGSGGIRILTAEQIRKNFIGNTLHVRGGPTDNSDVWQFHPDDKRMIFTATKMRGRQVMSAWRVTANGAYCIRAQRQGDRCFRIAVSG